MSLKSIIKNIPDILGGVKNGLIKKQDVEDVALERAEICNICPIKGEVAGKENCSSKKYGVVVKDFQYDEDDFRKEGELHNGCGCFLYLKQRCMGCACPLGKWEAIVNKIESDKLEELYNE